MSLNSEREASSSTSTRKSLLSSTLLWFAGIAALFLGARLWRLTGSCLWFDELFSVHAARHSWSELFYFTAADIIHPPLFYVLLKVWIAIGGEGLQWSRLLPALIAIVSPGPLWLLGHELKLPRRLIYLAMLFLAVNGYLIKYAQEVRMYSLLFLLSLLSLWLFFRFVHRDRTSGRLLTALFLINLLMVYTHYAGWLLVFLEAVVLFIWYRQKLRRFVATVGVIALAYAPWIYEVYKVSHSGVTGRGIGENIGWVTKPGLSDLLQYFVLLNRPFLFIQSSTQLGYNLVMAVLVITLFALPLCVMFFKSSELKATEHWRDIRALALFLVAPIALAFIASWISPYSVWGTRHLIIAAGPYALLAAYALINFKPDWARTTLLAVYGTWLILSGAVFLFSRQPQFIWCTWEPLARQVAAENLHAAKPVQIYAYEDLVAYHLWFALSADQQNFKVTVIKGVPGMAEDPAYFLPRAFPDVAVIRDQPLSGENVWIAFRGKQWNETAPPLDRLKKQGFRTGKVFSFKTQGQEAFLVQILEDKTIH
jgi:uncharacterized membrane protein